MAGCWTAWDGAPWRAEDPIASGVSPTLPSRPRPFPCCTICERRWFWHPSQVRCWVARIKPPFRSMCWRMPLWCTTPSRPTASRARRRSGRCWRPCGITTQAGPWQQSPGCPGATSGQTASPRQLAPATPAPPWRQVSSPCAAALQSGSRRTRRRPLLRTLLLVLPHTHPVPASDRAGELVGWVAMSFMGPAMLPVLLTPASAMVKGNMECG